MRPRVYAGMNFQLLRKVFGPQAMPFFDFYVELLAINLGAPSMGNLANQFVQSVRALSRSAGGLSPPVNNLVHSVAPRLQMLLNTIEHDAGETRSDVWRRINTIYEVLIQTVAKDKGVYLKPSLIALPGIDPGERWLRFTKFPPKAEKMEKLKDEDPETFAILQRNRTDIETIQAHLKLRAEEDGRIPTMRPVMGRMVLLGYNPNNTGEDPVVYDIDGEVLPLAVYRAKRKTKDDALRMSMREPDKTQVPISQLRRLSDKDLERFESRTITLPWGEKSLPAEFDAGPLEMSAITDGKAKVGGLTRIFPTRTIPQAWTNPDGSAEVHHVKVIFGGRYKGVYLDDMVNSQGRLIEGTSFTFNPMTGRSKKVHQKTDTTQAEPYVTVADVKLTKTYQGKKIQVPQKKLFLRVPSGRAHTEARNALKALACDVWEPGKPGQKYKPKKPTPKKAPPKVAGKSTCIPGMVYMPVPSDPQSATFYFDPSHFGVVMDTLKQGMSLSSEALEVVKGYYKELSVAEAAASGDLSPYELPALGGFKSHLKSRSDPDKMDPVRLSTLQKRALAWMDANGSRGVCGLDTGVGKTLTSIAMMQKLIRDGLADPGAGYTRPDGQEVKTNGLFLLVVPKSLKGNHLKEIRLFLQPQAASDLTDKLDIVTYSQFSRYSGKSVPENLSGKPFWKDRLDNWDTSLYVAVIFDEAHVLKNPSSNLSKRASQLWHPRKICLTASPMEQEPMEAYVLAAICNNKPLHGRSPEARANQAERRRFKARYCETVRGRIIGVKQDPLLKQELTTWVKRNIFYADKRDDLDNPLPQLASEDIALEMPTPVEDVYRDVTKGISATMASAVALFRDRKISKDTKDPDVERLTRGLRKNRLGPLIQLMNGLSNYPGETLRRMAEMMEENVFINSSGKKVPMPDVMEGVVKAWARKFTPDTLRNLATQIGNPKLEAASTYLARRVDRGLGDSRTLLFSDDPMLCELAAQHMAKTVAGDLHVLALDSEIRIFSAGGSELTSLIVPADAGVLSRLPTDVVQAYMDQTGGRDTFNLPFRPGRMKRYPMLPAKPGVNQDYKKDEWQQFVLKEIVQADSRFRTATLLGKSYSHGHNLQAFDTVIHLDRDSWNAEAMKQRTARSWRQGQDQPVTEVTLDMIFKPTVSGVQRSERDPTLDDIRRYLQELDGAVFDQIIKDSHRSERPLGDEWLSIDKQDAAHMRLDRKTFELAMSPFLGRVVT